MHTAPWFITVKQSEYRTESQHFLLSYLLTYLLELNKSKKGKENDSSLEIIFWWNTIVFQHKAVSLTIGTIGSSAGDWKWNLCLSLLIVRRYPITCTTHWFSVSCWEVCTQLQSKEKQRPNWFSTSQLRYLFMWKKATRNTHSHTQIPH